MHGHDTESAKGAKKACNTQVDKEGKGVEKNVGRCSVELKERVHRHVYAGSQYGPYKYKEAGAQCMGKGMCLAW